MRDNIKKFYETDSSTYDFRWMKKGGRITSETQMKIVSSLIESWEGFRILELGCGSGRFSANIARVGSSSTFIDLTIGMLNVTRTKLASDNNRFNGINASGYAIPLASSSSDAVISINVFNHIEEPAQVLNEIHRILVPQGKLLINFSNVYSYYFPFARYVNRKHISIGRDVYSVWSKPNEVIQMLATIGFSIIDVVGHVFVPLFIDKPIIRQLPIVLDGLSRKAPLKWIAPSLFFYCEKK